tara:strand:- start:2021 stop:2914 length:894 start_codon:yes stop_codon:yes gene_type:complete
MQTVDLFAGCGGLSLGFQKAGFSINAAYDNWTPAVEVYRENFTHPVHQMDLENSEFVCSYIKQYSPEVIIGGPPCQDFSIAGERNESSGRANLTISFAKIVAKAKPTWVVMENVYNIEKSYVLPKALDIFKKANYGITTTILDASFLGAPQARKRFFLIGHLYSKDGFLQEILVSKQSKKRTTVYDYLGDSLNTEFYYMHPRSYNRRAVFSIHEPSATIRGVNRPIPSGYKKHPADKAEISNKVRPLKTKERSYIQTFPKRFKFSGNKTNMEQLIGNAVPPKMAEYVAKCILRYLKI